jgi:exodeoxyribonuclease V alpha subunit
VSSLNAEPLFHPDSRAEESIAVRHSADEVQFRGVELLEGPSEAFLERWLRERIQTPEYRDLARRELEPPFSDVERETLARLQSLLDGQQVLAVTRSDIESVNRALGEAGAGRTKPVIALRDDEGRGLVGGESGLLVRGRVVFPSAGRFDAFDREALGGEVALAYAITVRESQGSEYDHVALILPEPDHPLLSRQLLYTAITRARKSFTILGKKDAVIAAIARSA